jgi:anti-sigma regulatory factor (Ser/Thr protein kinase)
MTEKFSCRPKGTLDAVELCGIVQQLVNQFPLGIPNKVEIDFSLLTFVQPVGVTFLSNFIHWVVNMKSEIVLTGLDTYSEPIRYLDDSMFFLQHTGRKLRVAASPRQTTLPLQNIHIDGGFSWLRNALIPWLSTATNLTSSSLYPFQTCIAEMFNNIRDHSTQKIGSVFVQHFPKERAVRISIADFGRGIPNAVRTVLPNIEDNKAILEAVKEGFTTKSTRNNSGIGLDYLLRTAVLANSGRVTIHSLHGHVLFTKLGNSVTSRELSFKGWCPGTTIYIEFPTDSIVPEPEDTEELLW